MLTKYSLVAFINLAEHTCSPVLTPWLQPWLILLKNSTI